MTNYYGFESTDEVTLDKAGLPIGTYKAMIVSEEPEKDDRGLVIEYEVLEGAYKGRRGKQWLLTLDKNPVTSNIAKQNIKRIAEATGRPVTPTSPLKNRVLTLQVGPQKNNPDYSEIKKYLPENHTVNEAPF